MSRENKEQTGLILWLSQQALPIRLISFFVFVILIAGAIVGATGGLYYLNVSNFPRLVPAPYQNLSPQGNLSNSRMKKPIQELLPALRMAHSIPGVMSAGQSGAYSVTGMPLKFRRPAT